MAINYKKIGIVFCLVVTIVFGDPNLLVKNNGPAVLDGNVTFLLYLNNYNFSTKLLYIFDDGIQHISLINNDTDISSSFTFSSYDYEAGFYNMSVSVSEYESNKGHNIIASNYSIFELRDSLIGKIIVNCEEGINDVNEVAVGEILTVAAELHDPDGFLKTAKIDYMWSIDYDRQSFMLNNFSYKYSTPETSIIVSNVVASLPNNVLRSGVFYKKLTVKDPVGNVDITGNPFIHRGEMLLLNVTCNGSSPFMYCARPLHGNDTWKNFSCNPTIVSTTCNFPIQYYFRNYGNYYYGIYISNDVKIVKRNISVVVYNVSMKPQLSTVIIPIVCSLLALVIISGGIAFYVQQRNQIAIEVANFDFQEDPEPYAPKTFFEQIFDSFMCRCGYSSVGDTEIFCEEEESLLAHNNLRRFSF